MKKRLGYNVIELLVVITAISLITAIAYKGVNILINNIKVEGVKTEINKLKTALAKSQAVGNVYWGGNPMNGTIKQTMSTLVPLQNPDSTTCNFHSIENGTLTNNCAYDNIIAAEKELFKQIKEMEFKFDTHDNTFRSSQFPSSRLGFLPNTKGYAGIIMTDIPGNIAVKLYQDLNTPNREPLIDGLSSTRPLLIFDGSAATFNTFEDYPEVSNPIQLGVDNAFLNFIAPTGNWDNTTITLDTIETMPRVTIIFIYTYRNTTWN